MSAPAFSVRVEGLGRAYADHYALVGLDADFPAGTITALLGPVGAGKVDRCCWACCRRWRSDRRHHLVWPAGAGGSRRPRNARRFVGYVGHHTMVYGTPSARENLFFFSGLYGLDRRAERVERRSSIGLQDAADRPAATFSRGMAQRLTLARALLPEPPLLLLDEPLTGLDPAGVEVALGLFAAQRTRGAAIILASHDLGAVEQIADRALILRRGRRRFLGPVEGSLVACYHAAVGVA
ncbi:MAG: ATP-binding cassette domain-containing protein [bacterium]